MMPSLLQWLLAVSALTRTTQAFSVTSLATPTLRLLRSRSALQVLQDASEPEVLAAEGTSDVLIAGTGARPQAMDSTTSSAPPLFRNIMAANRAEIAVRIMRAATELNSGTVAIYVHEDRKSQHRWGADRSFLLEKATALSTPISAYLDIPQIIQIAQDAGVDAIHPGYGFLSESPEFAQACAAANIAFVGPTVENLERFADKTSARAAAIEAGVPVVPGSDGPMLTQEDVVEFVTAIGLPVILKAAMGGGGKGMRVVRRMEDLVPMYIEATSEALASFGDGSVFVERFVERPRHIEVQIVGDGTGNVVHLWERDCSVQRRHQKVIEMAPAWTLPDELRAQLHAYAVTLTSAANYKNGR
jgi:pyruvate carboxylase